MNTQRNPTSAGHEASLRERAAAARAATARQTQTPRPYGNPRSFADQFDFSAFSVIDIARLFEIVRQLDIYLGHLSNMPLCTEPDVRGYPMMTPVGRFIESEEMRITFLRDRCVAEIARCTPQTEHERDEILAVRITHGLDCGQRIDDSSEPGLLIEALKAWG